MARAGERLRPIDLARAAGISTQQVRNYADAGILPPTPRTDAGYRTFRTVHRDALLTFRALLRAYGPEPARAIMRAVHDADLPTALQLVDAGHAELHRERISLRETAAALEDVAEQPPDSANLPRSGMRIGAVARHLGVRTSALRVWESAGLLNPDREPGTNYRTFGAADVRDARMIDMLRRGRYPLPRVRPILEGLRRTGSTEALRAAIADREEQLTRRARAMLEAASQLHHYLAQVPRRGEAVN